jgi:hypothetical protein
MRDLAHLAGIVFDNPLLLSARKADTVLKAIGPRILDGFTTPASEASPKPKKTGARRYSGGGYLLQQERIAVLPIIGTLVRRGSWLDAESGLMSYAAIHASVAEMMDDGAVDGVMLELDTQGGEAAGCFDLCANLRALSAAADKPVWAHVNEAAASAGYAIASAADEIWIPTTGEVGSIGVLAAHLPASNVVLSVALGSVRRIRRGCDSHDDETIIGRVGRGNSFCGDERQARLDHILANIHDAPGEIPTARQSIGLGGLSRLAVSFFDSENQRSALRVREGDYFGDNLALRVVAKLAAAQPWVRPRTRVLRWQLPLELKLRGFGGAVVAERLNISGGDLAEWFA